MKELQDINQHYKSIRGYSQEVWNSRPIIFSFFKNSSLYIHKKTKLGWLWFLLDPFLQMLIWVFIFQYVFKIRQENYPVMLYSGITLWSFINRVWIQGMHSFSSKRYFFLENNIPRLTALLANFLSGLFSFSLQLVILVLLLFLFNIPFTINSLWAIPMFALLAAMAFGGSIITSLIPLFFPDFRKLFTHFMRLMFYITPIIYSVERIPKQHMKYYVLNPLCGVFIGYREALMCGQTPSFQYLIPSIAFAFITISMGLYIFYRLENRITTLL